jgi:hypothetical protein
MEGKKGGIRNWKHNINNNIKQAIEAILKMQLFEL